MSRRKKKTKRPAKPRHHRDVPPLESKPAETATVAWMLAMLATLAAEIVGIIIRLLMISEAATTQLDLLSATMLVVALVSGIVTLVLTPIVLKLRKVAPPRPIVAAACVMGVVPIATLIVIGTTR